jgi:hypothetical protein
MKELARLFDEGISFNEYVGTCSGEDRQKHLHYLQKMELTEEERERLNEIKADVKLLVFCNTFCNDCRIALALLENMKNANSHIHYTIVGRDGREELMRQISGGIGIPLILDITNERAGIVFNEYPDVVADKMPGADNETRDRLILEFRKGLYKKEMLQQFIEYLTSH